MLHYGLRELVESCGTVRKNTIQIAEEIPEAQYNYRPSPESRSVAETLVHIAWLASADHLIHEEKHLASFEGFDFVALLKNSEVEETRPCSKAEIIELLRTEGERWAQWVEKMPEHRAQLTVIQRLIGLVPHFTRNLPVAREKAA
jgi:uncharacterized damage-inducible protein DinB